MARSTLSRISDILRSNVNELLDQLEDPEKMVRQTLRDMEAEVDRVVGAVATAVASQRRLQREREQHLERGRQLQERAGAALQAGDEGLARRALEGRICADQAAADLEGVVAESATAVERLRTQAQTLRKELEVARNRQGTLIARIRAAAAVPRASVGGAPTGDPFADFQRLERRLEQSRTQFEGLRERLEQTDAAEAAVAEVHRERLGADEPLGQRFAELDMRQRVDRALAQLRAGTPAAGATGSAT